MSKLSQTLKVVSGTSTYQVPFYTTTEEANGYGDYATANVGGVTCYYPLGLGTSTNTGSEVKTPWKIVKSNTTYYVLTEGKVAEPEPTPPFTITVIQPSIGGTITVNGQVGTTFTYDKVTSFVKIEIEIGRASCRERV